MPRLPGKIGKGIRRFSVRSANLSSVTGVFSGACSQVQDYSVECNYSLHR